MNTDPLVLALWLCALIAPGVPVDFDLAGDLDALADWCLAVRPPAARA
ncbi:MAG: hypothetical protein M3R63_18480 [Actinomycetota bacterium]|nr:hypothetical protein [Actinomycetota bacterium]